MKGTVSWFNIPSGFGVIVGEDGERYGVHHSEICGEGFKKLTDGETVTFSPGTYHGKLTARGVSRMQATTDVAASSEESLQ